MKKRRVGTTYRRQGQGSRQDSGDTRIRLVALVFCFAASIVVFRLVLLMILQHSFYEALAIGSHEISQKLFPERGEIFIQDSRTGEEYPFAINKDVFLLYADTRDIPDDETATLVEKKLATIFSYDEAKVATLFLQLNKRDDPYEPIEQQIDEQTKTAIEELVLPGIGFVRKSERFYPESQLAAQVAGFVRKNEEGETLGQYGIEGYWQKELAGEGGFFAGARGAGGGWIPLAGRLSQEAQDGVNLVLTIDRTLQYLACEELRKRMGEYGAKTASLIIMDPKSGAIRAMCSLPDFDPNTYNKVDSIAVFNNTSIFTAYEPGSIFKPVAMAAALNENLVTPDTYFYDPGSVEGLCDTPIKNANSKAYEDQTMTGVLENSINTGMVEVAMKLKKKRLRDYIEAFGFGVKTGIEIDSEGSGTIESLSRNKGDNVDCYAATASFGQGITVTPLQMVTAFSVIANGGVLMKPYIIDKILYPSGKVDSTHPKEVRRVIDPRPASLLAGMLVSVIDNGQAAAAAVPGYYIAGKTGTAQIADRGGYSEETNHSFVGFGPIDDPVFTMIITFEKPERKFSSATAAPTFGVIAKEILDYYCVAPGR